ncbi:MAG: MopE-related protein [Polyangiales bacterium]
MGRRYTWRGLAAFVALTACANDSEVVLDPEDDAATPPADVTATDRARPGDDASALDGGAAPTGDATAPADRAIVADTAPTAERCNNGLDDDRDGTIDEDCPCAVGSTQPCFPGDPANHRVGACRDGMQRCEGTGEFGTWSACTGATLPADDVCGDGVDQDCNGVVDDGAMCCRAGTTASCYSGPAGTLGRGICRAGTRTCTTSGAPGMCMGEVLPRMETCNGVDDDCDGTVDEDCQACIAITGASTPWQIHLGEGPRCWGRTFAQHGDPGEYAFASIPPQMDAGWRPHAPEAISFDDPSTLCGVCECLAGGDFTYFQTSFYVPSTLAVSSMRVTIQDVDDGVSVAVFNTRYPNGIVDPGAFAYLGGGSTADLARYVVAGSNRVVLTHVDDCCMVRRIARATISLNGAPLRPCGAP